jgi:hypothetical protein
VPQERFIRYGLAAEVSLCFTKKTMEAGAKAQRDKWGCSDGTIKVVPFPKLIRPFPGL